MSCVVSAGLLNLYGRHGQKENMRYWTGIDSVSLSPLTPWWNLKHRWRHLFCWRRDESRGVFVFVWKYKWLGAIPMVRCGICAVSTLRMCFYACRISLISGLSNEDLICWVDSWNCRGYSVIGICFRISLVDANSFVLVSWYFDIWNLFSREFVFAGATFECSFCRVIGFERIAPTAYMMQLEMWWFG